MSGSDRAQPSVESLKEAGIEQLHRDRLLALIDEARSRWVGDGGAPDVVLLESMRDKRTPAAARRADAKQRQGGATGAPKAFVDGNTVYLLEDALDTRADALKSLVHETVGHWGLRRVHGDRLDTILDEIVRKNRIDVWAKAKAYGLDTSDPAQLREAAEEVLAELAEEDRDPTLNEMLEAESRALLRQLVPEMANEPFTRAELLANFIAPVRQRMRGTSPIAPTGKAPVWYSELARAIERAPMNAGSAQSWAQLLKGLTSKGVKADEIEWSGLPEWLEMQQQMGGKSFEADLVSEGRMLSPADKRRIAENPGRVSTKLTKQQVLGYLAANGVQLTETLLTESRPELPEGWQVREATDADREDAGWFPWVVVDAEGEIRGAAVSRSEAISLGWGEAEEPGETKYRLYTAPGGTNYRELLLTLPQPADTRTPAQVIAQKLIAKYGGAYLSDQSGITSEERDALEKARTQTKEVLGRHTDGFRSTHWEQANVVAHVRVKDRIDVEGRKTLYVEEIQSDWGQLGRKRGFVSESAPSPEDALPRAPFVTSTDAWVSLAIRRVIKMAVDGGYERVAFTTGEQSARAHKLIKQISHLLVTEVIGNDSLVVRAWGPDGLQVINKGDVPRSELPEMIGKEMASKAIEALDAEAPADYYDLNLKIGGEGMRVFYDQIVPSVLKDVLRKLGGDGLRDIPINVSTAVDERFWVIGPLHGEPVHVARTAEAAQQWIKANGSLPWAAGARVVEQAAHTQPGFDVTEAMRKIVAQGVPMFSRQVAPGNDNSGEYSRDNPDIRFDRKDSDDWAAGTKAVNAFGEPLVLHHGTGSEFEEFAVNPRGIFFAEDPEKAEPFSRIHKGGSPRVIEAHVSIKNPWQMIRYSEDTPYSQMVDQSVDALKAKGYDGIYDPVERVWIAFSPQQIRLLPSSAAWRAEERRKETTRRIADATSPVSPDYARALVAGRTEKPGGVDPERMLGLDSRGKPSEYRLGDVPLELFVDNESGDRYDGTVDPNRARAYAERPADGAPPVIALQGRDGLLRINDGGHRITAARLRGDATISALVRLRDQNKTSETPRREAFNRWFDGSKIVDAGGKPLVVYHGTNRDFTVFQSHAPQTVYSVDGVEVKRADSWDMGDDRQGAPDDYHYMAILDAAQLGPEEALRHRTAEARGSNHPDTVRMLSDLQRLQGKKVERRTESRPTGDGFYFSPDRAYPFIRDMGKHEGGNVMPVYLSIRNPVFLNASQIEGAGASFNVEKYKAQGYDGAVYAEDPSDLSKRGFGGSPQIVAFDANQIKSAIGNNGEFDAERDDIRFRRGSTDHGETDDRSDLVGGFADASTTITRTVVVSSKGEAQQVTLGNLDSAGRLISPTLQGLENFWDWYADCAVRDDADRPLALYHATSQDFTRFETMRETKNTGLFGSAYDAKRAGIFMTPDIGYAEWFVESKENASVMPVYARIENPADLRRGLSERLERELEASGYNTRMLGAVQYDWELFDEEFGGPDFVAALTKAGYDGAVFNDLHADGSTHVSYVAFKPEQVKSALGNRGTWSGSDADIRFRRATDPEPIAKKKTDTDAFRNWFGQSAVKTRSGEPLVVYHGTTNDFSVFDPKRGTIDGDFGAGLYFSSSKADVEANYAGFGPDLTNRIGRIVDQLRDQQEWEDSDEEPKSEEELHDIARSQLSAHEGATMPVYLRMERPLIIGGPDETTFDWAPEGFEDDGTWIRESGSVVDFIESMLLVSENTDFMDWDVSLCAEEIRELAFEAEGDPIKISDIIDKLRKSEHFLYAADTDAGDSASSELLRQIIQTAGYDGIIDRTVWSKFGDGVRARNRHAVAMDGISRDTAHYIVFKPEQVKSAIGNSGQFDPENPDIRFVRKARKNPIVQALKSSEVTALLADSEAQSGAFDGGCLICAKAVIMAAGGGEYVRIVSDANGGQTEHYGSLVGGRIYDAGGVYKTREDWIEAFKTRETASLGARARSLSVEGGHDPDSEIPDDPACVKKIASVIVRKNPGLQTLLSPASPAPAMSPKDESRILRIWQDLGAEEKEVLLERIDELESGDTPQRSRERMRA